MKARLYRGPHADKVIHVHDKDVTIEFAEMGITQFHDPNAPVMVVKQIYKRTGHTHPDGSVYFEWDKPRGSRSGQKPKKPKKKTQPQVMVGNWVTGTTATTTFPYTIAP